jgi:signal transduction histidine kinase
LLQADSVTWEEYRSDARLSFFRSYKPGEVVQLVVQRDNQTLVIPWQITTATLEEISDHLTLLWVPYIFWLMGTIALFSSNVRDSRRTMYIAFTYLTAVWMMAGLASSGRFFYSAVIMRMGIWLSVPVYWHFHWLFPQPLPRIKRRFFWALYLIFGFLALAEWFSWMPASLFPVGVILALIGSLALLFAHLIFYPEQRRSLGVLGIAVAFTVAPGILIMISYLTNSSSPWAGSSVLLMTASIPVAYYYAVFSQPQTRMGTATSYTITPLFFGLVTYSFLALGMLATQIWRPSTGREVPLAVDISAMVGLFTAILYPYVQNVLDRRVLGITIPPTQVLETYSARITTTLDIHRLVAVLRDEVLPSLSIHQAALLVLQPGNNSIEILFQTGIPSDQKCELADYAALKEEAGRQRNAEHLNQTALCSWAHLALRLSLQQQEIGLLLLGRRDLGGSYSQVDISALQALADQTALALVNIHQAEQLHALYQHDVLNQEAMQHYLARELHDQVLNQLAALANQMDDQRFTPELQDAYQKTVNNIRDMISGLRPSMLNYGLYAALQELVDDLNKQAAGQTEIRVNLSANSERYPPEVELQLFRIAQQAVHNTLQHGSASLVEISGRLLPNLAELRVDDNGKGFDIPSPFDVISLLERQHFGLAGMYERAAIINANIELHSRPGEGTHITVRWQLQS